MALTPMAANAAVPLPLRQASRPGEPIAASTQNADASVQTADESDGADILTLSQGALRAMERAQGGPGPAPGGALFGALRQFLAGPGSPGSAAPLARGLQSVLNGSPSTRRLLESARRMMDHLRESDGEAARRLELLLKTLEKFGGKVKDPDAVLSEFERVMTELSVVRFSAQEAMVSLGEAVEAAGRAARTEFVVERQSFVFEFEFYSSTSVSATIAELEDNGFSVQQFQMEQTESFSLRIELTTERIVARQSEPLVLDLNGDGVRLTGHEDGVDFDIDGDGVVDRTAFAREGDGFLALDRNGNGRIDSGQELFGDQHGAINGYEELAKFDDNGDARIDRRDAVYQSLGVIRDANSDGRLDPGEFMSLEDAGVEVISLVNELLREDDGRGNTFAERGRFQFADGRQGQAADVWLGYVPGSAVDTQV